MKKGEIVIAVTSVIVDGKLKGPGSVFEIGKDMGLKDANRFAEKGSIKHHIPEEDEDAMTIEEMAETENLKDLSIKELKAVCKHLELSGYSKKNEAELIAMIENHRKESDLLDLDEMNEDELRALAEEENIDISGAEDIEAIRSIIEEELGE